MIKLLRLIDIASPKIWFGSVGFDTVDVDDPKQHFWKFMSNHFIERDFEDSFWTELNIKKPNLSTPRFYQAKSLISKSS